MGYEKAGDRAGGVVGKGLSGAAEDERALRDMRRYTPVVIQSAGQVNVGQQQVNLASTNGQAGASGGTRENGQSGANAEG